MPLLRPILRPIPRLPAPTHHRAFATTPKAMAKPLRIGYVPEHFSTPLHFASKYCSLNATLIPFPSGTGHMIQSLQSKEIDVGVGLTEGWVAGLAKHTKESHPYKIIGTYVESSLCWAISTGKARGDIKGLKDLRGKRIGVSRVGSGSYVMGFVLADDMGWLQHYSSSSSSSSSSQEPPFEVVVLDNFKRLRDAVNSGEADFFMWEHFTSKKYYDSGEIKRVGEIYTPWSSWKIVAREPDDARLSGMMGKINKGIEYFRKNQDEAVEYISRELDYSEEDAVEWVKGVDFAVDVRKVDGAVIRETIKVLGKAGVLDAGNVIADEMMAVIAVESKQRKEKESTK
ncbi:periplasmic binding protein-like II [Tothia fuscella]|uniref:Periplasmic binding protein-like II n=1 Tax=Tothia fuscella TaxID=1048955 RepID=A0A9P4NFB2_9PEZI|nr:periplasmic binding protein-like II [Tothia fuscella]